MADQSGRIKFMVYPHVRSETLHAIRVAVYYTKGGYNNANGRDEPQGICATFMPITVEGGFEKCAMFSGRKVFLEAASRLNRKRIAAILETLQLQVTSRSGQAWEIVDEMAREHGAEIYAPPVISVVGKDGSMLTVAEEIIDFDAAG